MAVRTELKNIQKFADAAPLEGELLKAHGMLIEGTGRGADFLGWVALPKEFDRGEYTRVKAAAKRIRDTSDVLLVVGIGGSYLGARAAIEFIKSPNYNLKPDGLQVFFAGNTLSAAQTEELFALLDGKEVTLNVISKSGTTTEPAVAFRIFREYMEKRYGAAARQRIYATTDKARGALKALADTEGYECFVIPDDVGGRYSVLTPVGLLPVASAGIDTDEMLEGAASSAAALTSDRTMGNPAWLYAAARNALYRKGFTTEVLAAYEPRFKYFAEWWKQLYGESEGKEQRGIFPASVELTADLHSMGQFIQEGARNLFETVVSFESGETSLKVPFDRGDADGLNFLAGKELDELNTMAMQGTALAHVDGGVPNILLEAGRPGAGTFGELAYFFEFACGLSGYLLGVNPFDQPGVEAYKQNMYALIGKPGFEARKKELEARL